MGGHQSRQPTQQQHQRRALVITQMQQPFVLQANHSQPLVPGQVFSLPEGCQVVPNSELPPQPAVASERSVAVPLANDTKMAAVHNSQHQEPTKVCDGSNCTDGSGSACGLIWLELSSKPTGCKNWFLWMAPGFGLPCTLVWFATDVAFYVTVMLFTLIKMVVTAGARLGPSEIDNRMLRTVLRVPVTVTTNPYGTVLRFKPPQGNCLHHTLLFVWRLPFSIGPLAVHLVFGILTFILSLGQARDIAAIHCRLATVALLPWCWEFAPKGVVGPEDVECFEASFEDTVNRGMLYCMAAMPLVERERIVSTLQHGHQVVSREFTAAMVRGQAAIAESDAGVVTPASEPASEPATTNESAAQLRNRAGTVTRQSLAFMSGVFGPLVLWVRSTTRRMHDEPVNDVPCEPDLEAPSAPADLPVEESPCEGGCVTASPPVICNGTVVPTAVMQEGQAGVIQAPILAVPAPVLEQPASIVRVYPTMDGQSPASSIGGWEQL